MPKGIRKAKPVAASPTIHDRIRDAEKALTGGSRETVLVSEESLELVVRLIEALGSRKSDILRRAISLGLQVLEANSFPDGANEAYDEIEIVEKWQPDPIFIPKDSGEPGLSLERSQPLQVPQPFEEDGFDYGAV
jgi:hypothetical protein